MGIKILYEDKDILAIDKPSGISVHPDGRSHEATITDWVLKNYPKLKGVGEPIAFNDTEIDRPGIVHRLDKETSGVLLIVKNKNAFAYFKKQFMDRQIKKTYNAFVSGWVKDDRGVINKPIGRSPSDFRRRLAGRGARGELREAVTEYKVLKRILLPINKGEAGRGSLIKSALSQSSINKGEREEKFTFLEIKPKTGRTHQIRVHMKFLNHPVVCDSLYDPKGFCPILPFNKKGEKIGGLSRLALHAKSIEFKDIKGKIIKIESPLPKEFKKIIGIKN